MSFIVDWVLATSRLNFSGLQVLGFEGLQLSEQRSHLAAAAVLTMGFFISAKWAWWAFKFVLRRREELERANRRGIVVVVTGGASGLGLATIRAICSRLEQIEAREKHSVILTSTSQPKGLVSR